MRRDRGTGGSSEARSCQEAWLSAMMMEAFVVLKGQPLKPISFSDKPATDEGKAMSRTSQAAGIWDCARDR